MTTRPTNENGEAILRFWFEKSKPYQWFRRDDAFDAAIKSRFDAMHKAASEGRLEVWRAHPAHSLSLIILLDQFSRNLYRDTPRAFAQDDHALEIAREAIRRRFDQRVDAKRQAFFYMPFMHAERLSVQEECVDLFKARLPGTMNVPFAIEHRDIVKRFGRFPHRNKVLGRQSTTEEISFLLEGGFNP
ncbi:DUF924 family protein [Hyphococcus sp.]|uniref:DUF924 family protein n=1 Tax=Hyphococcus sp. TaxID=2038636 RepID=UPI00208AD3FE|nr:MAG: hypothetical protein DHS20C04_27980 [Marinicaulis sp.]